MTKKIKLVLSGSGVLYPCHVGGIICLADNGYEISEVCGTSGGSIIAAALASGYKPNDDLVNLVKQTLPSKNNLIDWSLWSLLTNWGLIKGDKIEQMLQRYFAKTFATTSIPLHIVTTNLDRQQARVFSTQSDPAASVAQAVRASMSIPGVFVPVKINNELYVDGGVSINYFLDIFGSGDDVIGLRFKSIEDVPSGVKINGVADYVNRVIDTMITASMEAHIHAATFARTIIINSVHKSLNFEATEADVDAMIQEGYVSTKKWLENQPK